MQNRLTFLLTALQVFGVDWSLLFAVEDDFEWVTGPDGKRHPGNRIGTRYIVPMLQNQCAPVVVKTPEITPVVSAEDVAAACLSGQFIRVRFDGFKAEAYQGKNGLAISASADKAVIVTSTPGTTSAKT